MTNEEGFVTGHRMLREKNHTLFYSPPKPCVLSSDNGNNSFLDSSASLQYSFSQRQPIPLESLNNNTVVEVVISNGTIFHPRAKVLIILPGVVEKEVIKVAIGMYNIFEEKCDVEIDLSHAIFERAVTALSVIGDYNIFGPKSSVIGMFSIGSYNSFEANCCVSGLAFYDYYDPTIERLPCIRDGCTFAPLVNFHFDPLLHSSTWDHVIVYLVEGKTFLRSAAQQKMIGMPSEATRQKELESLCATMRFLMGKR